MFFKKIFFAQVNHLYRRKEFSSVELPDLPALPNHLQLQPEQVEELSVQTHSPKGFVASVWRYAATPLKWAICLAAITFFTQMAGPILLRYFLQGLAATNGVDYLQLSWIGLLMVSATLATGFLTQHYFHQTLLQMQLVTGVINGALFRKSLRLQTTVRDQVGIGEIVNHLGSDADQVAELAPNLIDLCVNLLVFIGVVIFLTSLVGWSVLPLFFVVLLLLPIVRHSGKLYLTADESMMRFRDQRMSLIGQILQHIRLVRVLRWQKALTAEVADLRRQERVARFRMSKAEMLSFFSYSCVAGLTAILIFWTHSWRGFVLSLADMFAIFAALNLIEGPLAQLSRQFSVIFGAKVAIDRICKYLSREEVIVQPAEPTGSEELVKISQVRLCRGDHWSAVINELVIKRHERIALLGPVGSGKSTLLAAILDEHQPYGGEIKRQPMTRAVALQEPFLFTGTVIENICFGKELNVERFRVVLFKTCLDVDIQSWPQGWNTLIGEKGVNLSGGQKQRMMLARTLYQQADLTLWDDPFSALDDNTAQLVFDRVIRSEERVGSLLVTTHRLKDLRHFDRIYYFNEQHQLMGGLAFADLMAKDPVFLNLLKSQVTESKVEASRAQPAKATASIEQTNAEQDPLNEESRERGAVGIGVYRLYWQALTEKKLFWALLLLLLASLDPLLSIAQKAVVAQGERWPMENLLFALTGLLVLILMNQVVSHLTWLKKGLNAGEASFKNLFHSVLNAKVQFFDRTPQGRILQRFSRDQQAVDFEIQFTFEMAVKMLLEIVISALFIVVMVPWVLLGFVPLAPVYLRWQRAYRAIGREVKRIDSVMRSPRYAHFKETLAGLAYIRGFGVQGWATGEFTERLNQSARAFRGHYLVNRWFSVRIPFLGALLNACILVALLVSFAQGWILVGVVGLVLSASQHFWGTLNWVIRIIADMEAKMTSLERLQQYSSLPSEPARSSLQTPAWVGNSIEFRNVFVRYEGTAQDVLKGVDVIIPPGAQVGIQGRTGSGKSTFIQTLFGLLEPHRGEVFIGGVAMQSCSLEEWRAKLALIPQDPALLMGTLRSNLDRENKFSDEKISEALQRVGLVKSVQQRGGLSLAVSENGTNFSQGERQLLCLARALITEAAIVVMDEATANLDYETDRKIQETLRSEFAGKTVVIVAHRLSTLQDSDFVIELHDGRVHSIKKRAAATESELEPCTI